MGTDRSPGAARRLVAAAVRVLVRLPRYIALVPVYAYRWLISPMLPDTCIYAPSCSEYTAEAIRTHGALKGIALGATRISRCTGGFFEGGYDPVPADFSFEIIKADYRRHRRARRPRGYRHRRRAADASGDDST